MLTMNICERDCWCSECDNKECLRRGDSGADCPRYKCIYATDSPEYMNCENCLWLKGYKAEARGGTNA